jgi:hypothetical protein
MKVTLEDVHRLADYYYKKWLKHWKQCTDSTPSPSKFQCHFSQK